MLPNLQLSMSAKYLLNQQLTMSTQDRREQHPIRPHHRRRRRLGRPPQVANVQLRRRLQRAPTTTLLLVRP